MYITGFDQLRKHVPELRSTRGVIGVIFFFAGIFTLVTLFFLWVDWRFYEWMPDGEIIVMAIGFLTMSLFFSQKEKYRQKYGELAYRNAFTRFWSVGLTIVIASYIHNFYMPGPEIPKGIWWENILIALGWVMAIVGTILWARGIFDFGADNLALLYVYYPEEGKLVDSKIYGIIRHPAYAGLLRIGMGLGLINGNWSALIISILMPLGMMGLTRLAEEKELLERFPAYEDYRKRVPAFFPKIKDIGRFFRYLILGR